MAAEGETVVGLLQETGGLARRVECPQVEDSVVEERVVEELG